jgi:16S rRNA (guanine966-N2)-methyltransferase
MRIVAGAAKGRRLTVPPDGVRPTPDRVREAVFSSLADAVVDATMLDLFAGSGAMGLEALSRGAAQVTFVEHDRDAAETLRRNIAAVGLDGATVIMKPAEQMLKNRSLGDPFTLAYLDPPYQVPTETIEEYLALLAPHLANGATVIVERQKRQTPPTFPPGFHSGSEKRYGTVVLYRATYTNDASVHA